VLYTPADLKVHAKIALVKFKATSDREYAGLLATGNLNEGTARFYTDHILMTTQPAILTEVEKLFGSFEQKQKTQPKINFTHLLVAQHNLQDRFIELIDREILHARTGAESRITIKLNNLEERVLIKKLYAASNAGVQVDLIVRSICCLVPGVKGMSENIRVRRIVDRFLEHGRVYVFHNKGNTEVYLGSADWMNRNIYSRVEVCFPLFNQELKHEMLRFLDLQLKDNVQAVEIDTDLRNLPLPTLGEPVRSQQAIYQMITG
jgi:polyphosphate kinase